MKHRVNLRTLLPTKAEAISFIRQTTVCTAAVLLTISYGPRDPYVIANSPTGEPVVEQTKSSNLSLMNVFNPVELGDSSLIRANADNISVKVNGEVINFESATPFIQDDRTLVPLRGVFEEMGYTVDWDANVWSTSEASYFSEYGTNDPTLITISSGTNALDQSIYITTRNLIYQGVNKTLIESDVAPQMSNERYYLPLRAIAEATGATVNWDDATKTVLIEFTPKTLVTPDTVLDYGEGYTGIYGNWGDVDWTVTQEPGVREAANLQNYNHHIYYEGAPADNPYGLPEGAYYLTTDNAVTHGGAVSIEGFGGVTTMDGYSLYLGESRESIESKIGQPNSSYTDGEKLIYKYNDIGGVQISYTESGRVHYLAVISGNSNNHLNKGFTYGNSNTILGSSSEGPISLGPGEINSYGYPTLELYFGTDLQIKYQFRDAGGNYTSLSLATLYTKDQYADPF